MLLMTGISREDLILDHRLIDLRAIIFIERDKARDSAVTAAAVMDKDLSSSERLDELSCLILRTFSENEFCR